MIVTVEYAPSTGMSGWNVKANGRVVEWKVTKWGAKRAAKKIKRGAIEIK